MMEKLYCVESTRGPGLGYHVMAKDWNDAKDKVVQKIGETLGAHYIESYLRVHTITEVK